MSRKSGYTFSLQENRVQGAQEYPERAGIQARGARYGIVLISGEICIRGNDYYIKFQYLRSRWYSTSQGRFTSRDTWRGDYNRPASLNRWNYVEANPINFLDPSGYIRKGKEAQDADDILSRLKPIGVFIIKDWGDILSFDPNTRQISSCGWNDGVWELRELQLIEDASNDLEKVRSGLIRSAVIKVNVNKKQLKSSAMAPPGLSSTLVGDVLFTGGLKDN